MNVLEIILYILLFIVFISVLIIIHELGHLTMAKVFKVYCKEFSIGMGPLLFKHKGKNSETQFSIRAVPFGGYVSMVGEEGEDTEEQEELNVPKERTLAGIAKWKQFIVFIAGVFMNCISALIIFFVAAWIPQDKYVVNGLTISPEVAQKLNCEAGDYGFAYQTFAQGVYGVDLHANAVFKDGTNNDSIIAALDYTNFSFKRTDIRDYLNFYYPMECTDPETGKVSNAISKEYVIDISNVDYVDMKLTFIEETEDPEVFNRTDFPMRIYAMFDDTSSIYYYEDLGLKTYTLKQTCGGFGGAIKQTFADFGNGATIVVQSLQMLLTKPETWSQAGGIIAIGFTTSQTLADYGWSYFLYYWGVISVNLAILNILPFPGLDGWHLLVTVIEGISKKKIPNKVKNIVSFIGLAILVVLMIVLLFKDALKFIFHVGIFL